MKWKCFRCGDGDGPYGSYVCEPCRPRYEAEMFRLHPDTGHRAAMREMDMRFRSYLAEP